MGIFLTSEEVDALFDCGEKRLKNRDRAAFLYLRERMDSNTLLTSMGWKALSLALEELPVQGSTEKPFIGTRDTIRWILRRLEGKGLIEQVHGEKMMESVFRFPLYDRIHASEKRRPNEDPRSRPQENTQENKIENNVLGDKRNQKNTHEKSEKRTHYPINPMIEEKINPPTPLQKVAETGRGHIYPEAFLQAVTAYPKRHTSIDKATSYRAWSARVKEGHDPEMILAGIERYKRFMLAEGNVGTRYVKMMATFLGKADPPFFLMPWKVNGHVGITQGTDRDYDQVDYRVGATPTETVDWVVEGGRECIR
ncbi:MAG: hypothetical protein HQL95_00535 [Magnetococcales bacterium]|nr:hypothetical protein [Magnetococcales bacterium]